MAALAACGGGGGGAANEAGDNTAVGNAPPGTVLTQSTRLRPAHPVVGSYFGAEVEISADGTTLAVSAPEDYASSTTIDGNETERAGTSLVPNGSVHVHIRSSDGHWSRQAYLKVPDAGGKLGTGLAMSPDGNRLLVGAAYGKGIQVDFDPTLGGTESGFGAGRLYQFDRGSTGGWQLSQSLAIPDGRLNDKMGDSVAMSDDMQWVVVGAPGRDYGDVTTPADFQHPVGDSGAAYVFRRDIDGRLVQQLRLRAPTPNKDAGFGATVAMSADGQWIAVGAPDDSTDSGFRPVVDPIIAETKQSGAVHVFRRQADGAVTLFASLKAPQSRSFQRFGCAIAFSGDGHGLAIGADSSGYSAETVPIFAVSGSDFGSGLVHWYRRTDAGFALESSLEGPRATFTDRYFGYSVDLSADGRTLAVGMPLDGSAVGSTNPGYVTWSGTVRLYELGNAGWAAVATMRASPLTGTTRLGKSIALSRDGRWLAAGAPDDATPGAGIDPPATGEPIKSGAAYVYQR